MVRILQHFDAEMEAHRNALIIGMASVVDTALSVCQEKERYNEHGY